MIYLRIDQIMIKEILGEYEVGIYSAAKRISEAFYFVPMLICASLFPAILNAKKQSEELYKKRLQALYTFMVWTAIAIALSITFLADWIVALLFGRAYIDAAQVLIIHVWASIFVFLIVASGKWLIIENLQKLSFWRAFSGSVLNILLNVILIPNYGVNGAAVATLISYSFAGLLFDYLNIQTRELFFMKIKTLRFERVL